MSELKFHKCKICGCLFYHFRKDTYCPKCVPLFEGGPRATIYKYTPQQLLGIEERKKRERERWHARMADPAFREHERKRSIMRYTRAKHETTC
jgi:hypothetical protein